MSTAGNNSINSAHAVRPSPAMQVDEQPMPTQDAQMDVVETPPVSTYNTGGGPSGSLVQQATHSSNSGETTQSQEEGTSQNIPFSPSAQFNELQLNSPTNSPVDASDHQSQASCSPSDLLAICVDLQRENKALRLALRKRPAEPSPTGGRALLQPPKRRVLDDHTASGNISPIDVDPDATGISWISKPSAPPTKHRIAPTYSGPKYVGGLDFDAHLAEVQRKIASSSYMDEAQQAEFFLSSLDPIHQRMAKYRRPLANPGPMAKLIDNIRLLQPHAKATADKFAPIRRELNALRIGRSTTLDYLTKVMELVTRFQDLDPNPVALDQFESTTIDHVREQSDIIRRHVGELEHLFQNDSNCANESRFDFVMTGLTARIAYDSELAGTQKSTRPEERPTARERPSSAGSNALRQSSQPSSSAETTPTRRRKDRDVPCRNGNDCKVDKCAFKHDDGRDRQRDEERLKKANERQRRRSQPSRGDCFKGKDCRNAKCTYQHPRQ